MQSIIDNSQRLFLITGDMNRHIVCNLHHIPAMIGDFADTDSIRIQHFWNSKFRRASKKMLNEMFEGANMNFRFI